MLNCGRRARKGGLLQDVTGVNNPGAAYAANRVGQDDQLKILRTRIAEAEGKVIEVRSRLGDQHPDLLAAIEQRNELKKLQDARMSSIVAVGQAIPLDSQAATDEASRMVLSQYITGEVERMALEENCKLSKPLRPPSSIALPSSPKNSRD